MMESIVRQDRAGDGMTLREFYGKIQEGRDCPQFYRKAGLVLGDDAGEYLVMETLGKGRQGYVFLAYHVRDLQALKLSYERLEGERIFSTVKKKIGDDFRDYFLSPRGGVSRIDSFTLAGAGNRRPFDRPVYVTAWEPADATLSEKLEAPFGDKIRWFRDFLRGLEVIHGQERAHFDIKLDNLFLVGERLKIGDFEFYFKIEDFLQSDILFCGTRGHIAPEIFYDRRLLSTRLDIYSAGMAFAQLFTGRRFKGGSDLSAREKTDLEELYGDILDPQLFEYSDFRLNFKIGWFYEALLETELQGGRLEPEREKIYRLLLDMIEIEPGRRPTAGDLLRSLEGAGQPGKPAPREKPRPPSSTKKTGVDALARMLSNHDRPEVVKYCLLPDLKEKLREDRIKTRIAGVEYRGDDYDKGFFSFTELAGDRGVWLFGKEIRASGVGKTGEWNMLVITDYWNRVFKLGLEGTRDKKKVVALLDGKDLDPLDRDIFSGHVKATRKTVLGLLKTTKEG